MNPNVLSLVGIIVTVGGWVGFIIWRVFWGGRAVGEAEQKLDNIKKDVEDLYKAISTNNELQNDRYAEFYKEFNTLRLKIAKELGINGSN